MDRRLYSLVLLQRSQERRMRLSFSTPQSDRPCARSSFHAVVTSQSSPFVLPLSKCLPSSDPITLLGRHASPFGFSICVVLHGLGRKEFWRNMLAIARTSGGLGQLISMRDIVRATPCPRPRPRRLRLVLPGCRGRRCVADRSIASLCTVTVAVVLPAFLFLPYGL